MAEINEYKCPHCNRIHQSMRTGKTWFDMEDSEVGIVYFCSFCDSEYVVIYKTKISNPRFDA